MKDFVNSWRDYTKKDDTLFDDLLEEFDNKRLLSEDGTVQPGQKIVLEVPKMIPTKDWGNPDSSSYEYMREFVLRAAGADRDIKSRFDKLFKIFDEKSGITSTPRIISSLILIESLASILNSFDPAAGGFLFESFLALLTFGKQVDETSDTGLPIEDIIAFDPNGPNGKPMSLKLLNQKSEIKGSFANLVEYFEKYQSIEYIVGRKKGANKLEITSFTLDRNYLVDFLLFTGHENLIAGVADQLVAARGNWNIVLPLLKKAVSQSPDTQWKVAQGFWFKQPGIKNLAEIDLSTKRLEKLRDFWSQKLNDDLKIIFNNVQKLSTNVNFYYTMEDRRKAKTQHGNDAIKNTEEIRDALIKDVK